LYRIKKSNRKLSNFPGKLSRDFIRFLELLPHAGVKPTFEAQANGLDGGRLNYHLRFVIVILDIFMKKYCENDLFFFIHVCMNVASCNQRRHESVVEPPLPPPRHHQTVSSFTAVAQNPTGIEDLLFSDIYVYFIKIIRTYCSKKIQYKQ